MDAAAIDNTIASLCKSAGLTQLAPAAISEFSTRSTDETDIFTDERFVRAPRIED